HPRGGWTDKARLFDRASLNAKSDRTRFRNSGGPFSKGEYCHLSPLERARCPFSMKLRRILRALFAIVAAVLIVAAVGGGSTWLYLHPAVARKNGVVYGWRDGRNLTLDILRPAKPNGLGIALLVSGGWKSSEAGSFQSWIAAPLLHQGYTI